MSTDTIPVILQRQTGATRRPAAGLGRTAGPGERPAAPPPGARVRPARHACATCGQPACVHVLEGYDRGQRVVRRFCLDCVDSAAPWVGATPRGGLRPGLPVLAALCGLVLMVVGLFGDFLIPERRPGFGIYQQTGVLLAVPLLLVGVLLRVGPLALGGGLLLAVSISADWFGLASGPGIGWKQQLMIAAGALLTAGGLLWRTVRRRRGLVRVGRGSGGFPAPGTACEVGTA